jgi:hypothetical protein
MDETISGSRRTTLGLIGGLAFATGATPTIAAGAALPTEPRQAWASRDDAIALRSPSVVQTTFDPMSYLLIQETFARFGIAHDEVQETVLNALFTDGAELNVAKGKGAPFQVVKGREAIIANFLSVLSQQQDQRRHLMTNVVIQALTETAASALAYGAVIIAANGLTIGASVIYSADLRRGPDGHWRFSRLYIGMDDYAGQAPKV